MKKPIISAKTRTEFREYFVQTKVMRTITEAFDAAGVRCDLDYFPETTGSRRTLVEQYYHTVDWTDRRSVEPVIEVFETELRDLFLPRPSASWDIDGDKKWQAEREATSNRLLILFKFDGFEWVGGRLVTAGGTPILEDLAKAAPRLEGAHLSQQIQRMKDSVETDPSLAIGTAKELIETVCKTILEERGKPIKGTPEISDLTKAVLKELQLVPEGVPEERRGSDLIKAILRSLGTIGNDLAQLRGLYGTGHGKTAKTKALQPRHARLAVGTAGTLVTFLFETHQATLMDSHK